MDGEIYDYDPDYDVPTFLNRYPPERTFQQIDKFRYENRILEYLRYLNHVKITSEILKINLKPQSGVTPLKIREDGVDKFERFNMQQV